MSASSAFGTDVLVGMSPDIYHTASTTPAWIALKKYLLKTPLGMWRRVTDLVRVIIKDSKGTSTDVLQLDWLDYIAMDAGCEIVMDSRLPEGRSCIGRHAILSLWTGVKLDGPEIYKSFRPVFLDFGTMTVFEYHPLGGRAVSLRPLSEYLEEEFHEILPEVQATLNHSDTQKLCNHLNEVLEDSDFSWNIACSEEGNLIVHLLKSMISHEVGGFIHVKVLCESEQLSFTSASSFSIQNKDNTKADIAFDSPGSRGINKGSIEDIGPYCLDAISSVMTRINHVLREDPLRDSNLYTLDKGIGVLDGIYSEKLRHAFRFVLSENTKAKQDIKEILRKEE